MTGLNKFIQRAPQLTIIIILGITVFFAAFLPRLELTTDVKDFFPPAHSEVAAYNEIEAKFGGAEYIMVAMTAPDIFQRQSLIQLQTITQILEQIPGVGQARSLTSVDNVEGSEWGITMAPLIEEIPADIEELSKLRSKILADPIYSGSMVSPSGDAALIILEVKPGANPVDVAASVQKAVAESSFSDQLYLTGTPVLNQVLASSMKADLAKLFPLVLFLIALILYLNFRSLPGVLLPFSTALISVIWTLGLMALLGKQLSPLNAVMPIILVSLGSAYGIYILARFQEEEKDRKGKQKALAATLGSVGLAVLMAGATTIAGFASNLTSSISLMQDFGLFTAFGIMVALTISLTLIPAVLLLQKPLEQKSAPPEGPLPSCLFKLGGLVVQRRGLVLLLALAVIALAGAGLPRLKTDSNFFNFFDPDSQPKAAYELVKEKFSGSQSVEVIIKGDLGEPAVLEAMKAFQDDLEKTGLVGKPTSVVNLLERVNSALNGGDPKFAVLPLSRELTAQYLLLLEMNDEQGLISRFLTMDYQEGRIQALVKDASSEGTRALLEKIGVLVERHFRGLDVSVTSTGIIVLLNALADLIIQGQVYSLIFSLLSVFLIVRLLLKSWEGSVLSILLIFLTTLINFGLMGWLKIPLDIVTVLISSIGIGVGIDYSLHVYSRYREELLKNHSPEQALQRTIAFTGKAIGANAGSVVAGFLILIFSSFPPLRYFGSLVTATMAAASFGALTILPALICFKAEWKEKSARKKIMEV
ncbi:MAG: RND family transporter [Firmicutes bacterium]|nr:RND family transporter [Bacillota bacterium]